MRKVLFVVFFLAGCGVGIDPLGTDSTSTTSSASTSCTSTDTWASYGQSFFTANCRSCHEHTSQFSTQASVANSLARIKAEISSGAMPPSGLGSADKQRILGYLACDVP